MNTLLKQISLITCSFLFFPHTFCLENNHSMSPKKSHALRSNEAYAWGKELGRALCEWDSSTLKTSQKHIRLLTPLIVDKPSSDSSQRSFRNLQNLARGMKDSFTEYSPKNSYSALILERIEPILSVIIAASNYPLACKAIGAFVTQWANSPEASFILGHAQHELKRIERAAQKEIDDSCGDRPSQSYDRAYLLGEKAMTILKASLPTNFVEKIIFNYSSQFRAAEFRKAEQLLSLMKEKGDVNYITSAVSGFKDGFDNVLTTLNFTSAKEMTKHPQLLLLLSKQIIDLLADTVLEIVLSDEQGINHIEEIGASITTYAQRVAKL